MKEIKIPELTCTSCGWTWKPRVEKVYVCPHCHVYTWNKPRPLGKYGKKNAIS